VPLISERILCTRYDPEAGTHPPAVARATYINAWDFGLFREESSIIGNAFWDLQ
jgi:hypothetical protein